MRTAIRLHLTTVLGWIVALVGTTVYLLTLEPTVSFWDCGEFIATSHKLQIGHPPGAPLYQLLAHCFMFLAGDNPMRIAWWSNALSAVSGGLTAMFLFWTIVLLLSLFDSDNRRLTLFAGLTGTACYLFCDTAWFSATESEVYSLSMLFSSMTVWAMLRWEQCDEANYASRWLLLVALLLGLSVGVHLLTLLTVPVIAVIYFSHRKKKHLSTRALLKTALFGLLFFLFGLSPYLIIPIRANANPPINMGNPSSWSDFKSYITREQYEHAPLVYGRCFNSPIIAFENGKPVNAKEMNMLFPRMWKKSPHAEQYYTDWCGRHGKMVLVDGKEYYKPSFGDNLIIFGAYQIGYMYLRYLMWNFSGRYNDRQGFGNLQRGQFITGIPPIDRLYVGNGSNLPDSMPSAGHNRYFLLPLILGLTGLFTHAKRHKVGFWTVMTLFLMGGPLLGVYLNHPMYEPRERDYAYILSFYAFAIWIGIGAFRISIIEFKKIKSSKLNFIINKSKLIIILSVPLLMACQNWDDHDRSGRYVARDSAANLLDSCDQNAILFTVGDNDTFPLWYLQQVEKYRTDVQVVNISLLGSDSYTLSVIREFNAHGENLLSGEDWKKMGPYRRMMAIIDNNKASQNQHSIHFSHYASCDSRISFSDRLQLCGMAYRLADAASTDSVALPNAYNLMANTLQWHDLDGVYIDDVSSNFLLQYWKDALKTANALCDADYRQEASQLLLRTMEQIQPSLLCDPTLLFEISEAFGRADNDQAARGMLLMCQKKLAEQLEYYNAMSPSMKQFIPQTLEPLLLLQKKIGI